MEWPVLDCCFRALNTRFISHVFAAFVGVQKRKTVYGEIIENTRVGLHPRALARSS